MAHARQPGPKFLGSRKFFTAFALILVVVGLSAFAAAVLRHEVRSNLLATLKAVLNSNQISLDEWIEYHSFQAQLWASNEALIEATGSLLLVKDDRDLLLASPAQAQLRLSLDEQMRRSAYRGFFVIAPDGTSLASSRDANIGTPNLLLKHRSFFDRMLAGETVVITPLPSDVPLRDAQGKLIPHYPTMFSGAPIKGENGDVIAVLTFRIDPFHRYDAIAERGRTGITGETYFFDRHGVMISRSRFERQLVELGILRPGQSSVLSVEIRDPGANLVAGERLPSDLGIPQLTRMAAEALQGNAGENLDGYRDYRGVPVVGVWTWDERHGYGIATEVDYAEAYAFLRLAYFAVAGMSVLASILIFAFAMFAHRSDLRQVREEQVLRKAKEQAETALAELTTTQQQLVVSEKMASLGQLTAGIAHEIKNPLNFVNNFSETSVELLDELKEILEPVRDQFDKDSRSDVDDILTMLSGDLQKINHHGKRADSIVKSMLLHARGDSAERVPTSVNDLVEEAFSLTYHGERAQDRSFYSETTRHFDDSAGEAVVVPQEIMRALVNLFSNAFYAVSQRAKSDETSGVAYRPLVEATTKGLGDKIQIRIRDNGTGIPESVKTQLFDPFFTTKPTKEGTGLGLSMSYDIVVHQHHGQINVESEPGSFTEFVIELPRAEI